jgi:predicted HTH transcriptional regulator
MQEQGFIKNADYREIFNVQRIDARRALASMVSTGILELGGKRRGAHYRPSLAGKYG